MAPRHRISRVVPVVLAALAVAAPVACSSRGGSDTGTADTADRSPDVTNETDTIPSVGAITTVAPTPAPAPAPTVTAMAPPAGQTATTAIPIAGPAVAGALQSVLDAAASSVPSPDATVQAALVASHIVWASTSGPDPETDRPFRMASVGKTFTAATVLRLVETGSIALDDPVGALLLPETVALLEGDGYDLAMITVAHLLQHTGGLYDYAFGDGSPFLQDALGDRSRVWSRREQLELAVSVGAPLFAPGAGFRYSDTGYALLGEIIEVETGRPYADVMQDLLGFDRLGLAHIWLEAGQPAPDDLLPIARSFFDVDEISDLDFSLDAFGGGGLAGTTTDVARFFGAVFGGEVFVDPATLGTLLRVPETNLAQEEFGILLGDGAHGVYRMDIGGQTCWSHRGFLGTIAMACPDAGVSLVVTTNTALTDPLPIAADLLAVVLAD